MDFFRLFRDLTAPFTVLCRVIYYFSIHVTVHTCTYTIPRFFFNTAIYWPINFVEKYIFRSRTCTFVSRDEQRRIHIVAHPSDHTAVENFGLGEQHERSVAYCNEDHSTTCRACVRPPLFDGPLYNGHVHTVLGAFRIFPELAITRETLLSYDDSRVCLDLMYPPGMSASSPPRALVVMLPGLTGTSKEVYVRRMTQQLWSKNVAVAVLNARGVGDTPLDKPQIFSALFSSDLRHVLAHYLTPAQVQERFASPCRIPILAVAFSLGGLILTNYVGEQGRDGVSSGLDAVFTVCSPHNLNDGDVAMHKPLTRLIYGPHLLGGLLHYYRRHKDVVENLPGVDTVKLFAKPNRCIEHLRSVRDFDENITGPHFGFSGADAYYTHADNFRTLPLSKTPQMCIVAADDPICGPAQPERRWEGVVAQNKDLVYVRMPSGGHMGFLRGPLDELRQKPSAVEVLVGDSVAHFVDAWYVQAEVGKERGRRSA